MSHLSLHTHEHDNVTERKCLLGEGGESGSDRRRDGEGGKTEVEKRLCLISFKSEVEVGFHFDTSLFFQLVL